MAARDWRETLITPEDVQAWGCCEQYSRYSLTNLRALCQGKPGLTLAEIGELPIPVEDRLWTMLHWRSPIPDRERRHLACDFAEHVLPVWESWAREHKPDQVHVLRDTLSVARRCADGVARAEELGAAFERALTAARTAYDAADYYAASAAYAAAYAAEATRAAAAYAATTATSERLWQLSRVMELVRHPLVGGFTLRPPRRRRTRRA